MRTAVSLGCAVLPVSFIIAFFNDSNIYRIGLRDKNGRVGAPPKFIDSEVAVHAYLKAISLSRIFSGRWASGSRMVARGLTIRPVVYPKTLSQPRYPHPAPKIGVASEGPWKTLQKQ